MKKLSIIFFFISFQIIYSQEDTIFIQAHDYVDMDWYGNYDAWANFPSNENTYRKICVNDYCNIYSTYNEIYTFKLSGVLDTLKFYKPHYNE